MFGLVSKRKYNQLLNTIDKLKTDISNYNKKLDFKQNYINKLTALKNEYEQMIVNFDRDNNILKKEYSQKEHQRRLLAGRCGGYKRQINKINKENKEMMLLINNLITERQKMLKLKRKPTLVELKNYFK